MSLSSAQTENAPLDTRRGLFAHPLWLVGFRPFFALAFVSAVVMPLVWALVMSGAVQLPEGVASPVRWHAHEMLFGFGWAVLGGFLLTASKNWVGIRGLHGGPLAFAVVLWCVERVAVLLSPDLLPAPVRFLLVHGFALYVVGYVVWTLVRYRKQDSFSDNGFFIVGLPLFLVARVLVDAEGAELHATGIALTVGLFRLAFAVMFERTMTQFMKNAAGVTLPRWRWLDHSIKGLVLLAAFEALLPPTVAAIVLAAAAVLLFARLLTWKPLLGLRTFAIGIMYAGYFGLVVHLVLAALTRAQLYAGIGTLALHAFTFLTMGLIIPPMFIRICQGHTGRKLLFTTSDRVAMALMAAGAFFRLVATQLWPQHYLTFISLAAAGWCLCFAIIGVRLLPFLFKARVDGREH